MGRELNIGTRLEFTLWQQWEPASFYVFLCFCAYANESALFEVWEYKLLLAWQTCSWEMVEYCPVALFLLSDRDRNILLTFVDVAHHRVIFTGKKDDCWAAFQGVDAHTWRRWRVSIGDKRLGLGRLEVVVLGVDYISVTSRASLRRSKRS